MAEHTQGRTTSDLIIGALIILLGLVVLGHTLIATKVSLLFLGWLLFAGGVVTLAATLFRIGKDGHQPAAVTVTLVAGAMFLTTGLARLVAAFQSPAGRVPLLISGVVSTFLGLLVLFNLVTASYVFLGVILGVEMIAEGVAIMIIGRDSMGTARAGRIASAT